MRVNSNLVLVPASVVDSRGRAITDLKVADFELRVDGEVKPISDVNRAETPVHIALLFDNSSSLSTARDFEKQAATKFFASVVRPIDRAAVYSVSTVPTLSQPLTNDVSRLVRTIEHFDKPEGATALFDAISAAASYLRPIPGRKVIVIVSDGTDTVSSVNLDDAMQAALRADCQIYVVQTRQLEDPNLHDIVAEQRLEKITGQTGGAVFVPLVVADLDAVFAQISLDLAQQYVLSYYPQDERRDKYFRFITLRVRTRLNLRVRARRGFYPSSTPNDSTNAAMTGTNNVNALTGEISPNVARTASSNLYNLASVDAAPASKVTATNLKRRDTAASRKPGPDEPEGESESETNSVALNVESPVQLNTDTVSISVKQTPVAATSAKSNSSTPTRASTSTMAKPSPTPTPQPTPAGSSSAKAPVSSGVLNGKAIRLPLPVYPQNAWAAGIAGVVLVEVLIDETGKVIEARAASGPLLLQNAATNAARLAKFAPTMLSGAPVKVSGTIKYNFELP